MTLTLKQQDLAAELVELFRAALMREHSDEWTMEVVSEAAHVCARAAVEGRAVNTALPNPGHDADMLHRAAEASRNIKLTAARSEWFAWVPAHLDQLADRIDPRDVDDRGLPFVKIASR